MLSVEEAKARQGEVHPRLAAPAADLADGTKLSPAMRKLAPKARAFVMALVELGGRNMSEAAVLAGYTGDKHVLQASASRLAADPRVQEVLVEEAKALARSSSLQAVAETVNLMTDVTAPKQVRLNAASRIMTLAELDPEKKVHIDHNVAIEPTTREQIDRVIQLCRETGMDPQKLLGKAGIVIDAEFKVVHDKTGLEDLLG